MAVLISMLFDQIRPGVDAIAALTVGDELKENYGSSVYAAMGALSLAKIFVEEGKYDIAGEQLQWVLDNSQEPGLQHIARLRMASLLLAQEKYEEVLGMVTAVESSAFSARYNELAGDAYASRNQAGDLEKAREHYESSLEELPENSGNGIILQLKIDNLGVL